MYLCKNRNSNYYSRINIPKSLRLLGFPSEIRFSLHTKKRSEALDRALPIAILARQWLSSLVNSPQKSVKSGISQLRLQVAQLKAEHFIMRQTLTVSSTSVKRVRLPTKNQSQPKNNDKQENDQWLKQFLLYKENDGIRHSSVQQLGARTRLFLELLKKPLSKITSKDALNFKSYLIASNMSHKTQKETFAAAKQFTKWLRLNDVLVTMPFDGIVIKAPLKKASEDRQRWSNDALKHLFSHKNFTKLPSEQTPQPKREDFWIPLLLLFTGARTGEICQLMTRDIVQFKEVWCIDINDRGKDRHLKTAAATRFVPIHQQLIDWGLLEYVEYRRKNCKQDLFDLKPVGRDKDWYKAFSVRFARVLTASGFIGKQRPTLHSLRHSFVDELQQMGIAEHETSELVGHTKSSITYGRYGKSVNIERLNQAVQSVHFELSFGF